MRQFFKMFFASLAASVVFVVILVLMLFGLIGVAASSLADGGEKKAIGDNAVLLIDLNTPIPEQTEKNPFAGFSSNASDRVGLSQMLRLIHHASTDDKIKGIYIKGGLHANGFAATQEVRQAVAEFKKSKKFVIAYGDMYSQQSYAFASIAQQIYLQPQGMIEWGGLSFELTFFKRALDMLEVQPQVFYAGKFKSATEPFRVEKMTEPNRLQLTEMQESLYKHILQQVSETRGIDTATLRRLANTAAIRRSEQAVQNKLIDGAWYDDQVKAEVFKKTGEKPKAKINFVSIADYNSGADLDEEDGGKIALIYASGEIVDGMGDEGNIGSVKFKNLIRKARFDSGIKAIVLRVNSPGGSALASDVIWHELTLARKSKPVIVSMGDYAASGGYYISAPANRIFADQGTLTGSIGVFTIIPNMSGLLRNKLGITFDEVKTGPNATGLSVTRPLTAFEAAQLQEGVDTMYLTFKKRVAAGRNMNVAQVDELAQGRVWTGEQAKANGLVDEIGGLPQAIAYAARAAKLKSYRLRQYPEQENVFENLMGQQSVDNLKMKLLGTDVNSAEWKLLKRLREMKTMSGQPQARLPWELHVP